MKLGLFVAGRSAAVAALVMVVVLTIGVASAEAAVTTSDVTTPADGTLLFQNEDTNLSQAFTVSGTTNGGTGDAVDIACYQSGTEVTAYTNSGAGVAVGSDGSFSASVPQSAFAGDSCELLAVPHARPPARRRASPAPGLALAISRRKSSRAAPIAAMRMTSRSWMRRRRAAYSTTRSTTVARARC